MTDETERLPRLYDDPDDEDTIVLEEEHIMATQELPQLEESDVEPSEKDSSGSD